MPKSGEEIELESRKKIYDFIRSSPGCHLREIQRRLSMPTSTLEYHLKYLREHELIMMIEDGGYKRYYPMGVMGSTDRKILSILRQDVPRKIVIYLLLHPESKFKEIAENFDISPSTLSFHLKKLLKMNIVMKKKFGRDVIYSVVNEYEVARVLIAHRRSFLDTIVDAFVNTWTELNP